MNYIFYFHIYNDTVKKNMKFIKNLFRLTILEEVFLYDGCACFMCDDAHISCKPLLTERYTYFPVIGRCATSSINHTIISKLPDAHTNIQSAHFHSILGNNDFFIPLEDIPVQKRLNHSNTHLKVSISDKIVDTFHFDNPYNWHLAKNILNGNYNIYEYSYSHLMNMENDIHINYPLRTDSIFVAPFNRINDELISYAKDKDIQFICYDKVYDTVNNKELNVKRVNIEEEFLFERKVKL